MKTPLLVLFQMTMPVGVLAVPGEVSATVAAHIVESAGLADGGQLTLVIVVRGFIVTVTPPELAEWVGSPG